ncbi:tRNA (adenosine(37)-N6)-threonylcarbamoyltransferase complex dimerization subunit type 1 TsaB, partial [Deinococcus sp. 12RED42]|nr:tRNA (adenosine(37)-N6)-threonylcarbamoyltransferase complex dimerization subunit type 1 TsaB [Deinococcus sp. 12RED42]
MSTAAAPAPTVILALDTATPWLTLALRWPGGERRVSREVGRAHAEQLPGAVEALFAE